MVMAFYTERQKMEFDLLQCMVEPQSISSSSSSNASVSSIESDGDAPVIVVSDSRSDITAELCVLQSLH